MQRKGSDADNSLKMVNIRGTVATKVRNGKQKVELESGDLANLTHPQKERGSYWGEGVMGWKRSVGQARGGLEVGLRSWGLCCSLGDSMPGRGGNNEAGGKEAPVLSVFGLWVEHMLNHNVSHQNASFLEARGQSFLQVGKGRECCG